MTSYALIVNPVAGKGLGLARARALETALRDSADVRVLETRRRGSATELAEEVAGRVDRVLAVGGDGTLNEVLNGLLRAGNAGAPLPELGFLPAGTGNAATPALALEAEPTRLAAALPGAQAVPLDVGTIRTAEAERAFLLWVGAGWDAVLIYELNARRSAVMGRSGLVRGIPRVMGALSRYREVVIEASVDGRSFGPYTNVIVANIGDIPFGGSVTDRADPGDGLLDAVGVPKFSFARAPDLVRRLMISSLTTSKVVGHAQARIIELRSEGRVPLQVDGEPLGTLPASIEVRPGAVRFLRRPAFWR